MKLKQTKNDNQDDELNPITCNGIMIGLSQTMKKKFSNYHGVEGLEKLYSTQNRFMIYDFQNDKERKGWKEAQRLRFFLNHSKNGSKVK